MRRSRIRSTLRLWMKKDATAISDAPKKAAAAKWMADVGGRGGAIDELKKRFVWGCCSMETEE